MVISPLCAKNIEVVAVSKFTFSPDEVHSGVLCEVHFFKSSLFKNLTVICEKTKKVVCVKKITSSLDKDHSCVHGSSLLRKFILKEVHRYV
jgi:hypothetical protein